jgi:hypothetical protein
VKKGVVLEFRECGNAGRPLRGARPFRIRLILVPGHGHQEDPVHVLVSAQPGRAGVADQGPPECFGVLQAEEPGQQRDRIGLRVVQIYEQVPLVFVRVLRRWDDAIDLGQIDEVAVEFQEHGGLPEVLDAKPAPYKSETTSGPTGCGVPGGSYPRRLPHSTQLSRC